MLSYALLGFLSYAPMTGYDLKKILDDSINFFWVAQTSQIYRELKTLETEGYITSTLKPSEKGPDRREYKITESGAIQLKKWLSDLHVEEKMRNEFMIHIFFSSQIGAEELYIQMSNKLKEYLKEQQILQVVADKIQDYAERFGKEEDSFYWKIVLSRGIHDVDAKVNWAKETLTLLKSKM